MVTFGNTQHPTLDESERRGLLRMLIAESVRAGGPPSLRTWSEGQRWVRRGPDDDAHYSYRSMTTAQLTFDVGDNLPDGSPRPWADTVRDTELLWLTLNWMGAPYWGALTDGNGTDTTLFLRDVPAEGRRAIAKAIINAASSCLPPDEATLNPFRADPLLFDPHEGNRQLREFGAKKRGHTPYGKALWTVGPGQFEPLPSTREAAYARLCIRIEAGEDLRIPRSIPIGEPAVAQSELHGFVGANCGPCPQGIQCFPGPATHPAGWAGFCADCPAMVAQ